MTDPLAINPEPAGRFSFKQMIPTLVFDVAMPIVAFNVLTRYGVATLWALVAGGLFPAINNLRVWAKSRRLEPLGIIVVTFLAIGTATSLVSGSVFFALIRESFLTATFGFICLGSLLAERPLMFYIGRQFTVGEDPAKIADFNTLWQYPRARHTFRVMTLVWALGWMGEFALRVLMVWKLSIPEVLAMSPFVFNGITIGLIAWTIAYTRRQRQRGAEAATAANAKSI